MDRFIKKNLFLVGVLGISALGVLVLLILSFVQYFEMSSSMEKIEELRERNRKLMMQSIPAVPANINLVQVNTDGYLAAVDDFKKHFGHPLYPALKAFAKKLNLTPEQLQKNFADYWDTIKESGLSSRAQICRNYRDTLGKIREGDEALWQHASWEEAMEEFIAEARKSTLENISEQNYEEIFLASLGLPRNMGDSESSLNVFKRNMQNAVVDMLGKADISMLGVYFAQRDVAPIRNNQDFEDRIDWRKDNLGASSDNDGGSRRRTSNSSSSFDSGFSDSSNNEDKPVITPADEIRHWEIIADLARRIVEAKVDSLEELSYKDLTGREENGCHYYTYTLSVVGSEQQVRKLLNLLNAAYDDHRVYVVRNVSMSKKEDQVQDIIDMASGILSNRSEESAQLAVENNSPRGNGVVSGNGNATVLRPTYFVEEGKYPECVAGRSNVVEALFIIDYVVYSANTLK